MPFSQCAQLELKYCERCGGLWLRRPGDAKVYCARCSESIRELPPVRRRGGGNGAAAEAEISAALGTCAGPAGQQEGRLA